MPVQIRELHPLFVAQIGGVDISRPLSPADRDGIEAAIHRYAVVVFHDQALSDEQQVDFARRFGEPETSVGAVISDRKRLALPQMVDISNLADASGALKGKDDRGRLMSLSNQLWHSDGSYRAVPGGLSMLFAHVVPAAGGETEFCDLRAAYDELPAHTKAEIDGLSAIHDYAYSRELLGFGDVRPGERQALPPVAHPLVQTHPGSGRRTLFLGAAAHRIEGWPLPEGRLLLTDLTLHAAQRRYVYSHSWRKGDLVIWDNRCTLHRGRPYDETQARDLRRVTTTAASYAGA
jgi:alpha-ketoglutarate-dependent 2,4-dichlorophenoxyacetate dioxygenase